MVWETAAVVVALALALALRPWQMLRHAPLRHPWLAALVLLPWLWSTDARLPGGLPLQLSLAALMVLMFGWPLAVWTLVPVALGGAWIAGETVGGAIAGLAWFGLTPAALALLIGCAMRRWLPQHLMVYIMGRAFFATALAVLGSSLLQVAISGAPRGIEVLDMVVGRGLIGLGEAMATGLLVATMVVCRPNWLATYSDQRYLPRARAR